MDTIKLIVIDNMDKLIKTWNECIENVDQEKIIITRETENQMIIDFVGKENDKLQETIISILHELGIPSHIKGYQYIKEGIEMIYHQPSFMTSITKNLYPELARRFRVSTTSVERNIRHAIELGWSRANWDYMEELFGYSIDTEKSKPTNSEFITTIVDKINLD